MRPALSKPLLSVFAVVMLAGCTLFSIGPFRVELDLPPTVTAAPQNPPALITLTPFATSGIRPTAEVFPTATVDVNSADLVLTALVAVGTGVNPRCGENTRVDFTVENRGVTAAGATTIYIADYNGFVITTEAWYGIPPLLPGERYSGSVNIVVGRPQNVVHTLEARVDLDFTVNELDETNNTRAISYNVDEAGNCPPAEPMPTAAVDASTGANLVLVSVGIGGGVNPRCGEAAPVDFTIHNNGTIAVGATTLLLIDYVADTFDQAGFARVDVPALAAGASHNGTTSLVITRAPNVIHQLSVSADDTSLIAETNEDDNGAFLRYNVDDSGACG